VRKLTVDNPEVIVKELKKIGVDQNAYSIFIDKAQYVIYKFDGLSCAQANVFKQTALVCGADLAIPKKAYFGGRERSISAILFANRRELERIKQRLEEQPWIEPITKELCKILAEKPVPSISLGNRKIRFNRTYIMGAINLTDDSFYLGSRYITADSARIAAEKMEKAGADFIDIGAESSRPGAEPLTKKDEMTRLKQIFPILAKRTKIPLSIDTYKADIAAYAIGHGAKIVNDISGLTFDKKMVKVVAKNRVALVIMHMKGNPKNMQLKTHYDDLMGEIHDFLSQQLDFALKNGVKKKHIIVDPGLGFGKRLEDNYEIANRLNELSDFEVPILIGHSRKSFIGKPFNLSPAQRLEGTLGLSALLIKNGANILRVHDVLPARKVAALIDKVKK
jgi:dihydropteroate synthase